jgi:3-oxoacyl-[acyl-carrier protein] reductase
MRKQVIRMVSGTIKAYGKIDILVNNAGINVRILNILGASKEEWESVLGVNLLGTYYCIQAVAPQMISQRYGKIINISSRASLGKELRTVYGATKAALVGATRTWALELAQYNINVNALAPGRILTEMAEKKTDREKYRK